MDYFLPRDVDLQVFGSVERVAMGILQPFFQGQPVHVTSLFEEGMPTPVVIARNDAKVGANTVYRADARFTRPALLSIDTITDGLNADDDGAALQEACRIAIFEAWRKQIVIPGQGYIAKVENSNMASRKSDWATSTGPVQYASLPRGAMRYESNYRLTLAPDPNQEANDNPFVRKLTL